MGRPEKRTFSPAAQTFDGFRDGIQFATLELSGSGLSKRHEIEQLLKNLKLSRMRSLYDEQLRAQGCGDKLGVGDLLAAVLAFVVITPAVRNMPFPRITSYLIPIYFCLGAAVLVAGL